MNRNQRRMAAFNAKKAAEQIGQQRFERRIVTMLSSCNQRVEKALSTPSPRDAKTNGAVCMAEVALYSAGHRKVVDTVTAR
ncbi:hypothetical protein [Pantoea sp. CCBC3-3-1]|uniref:transcriptional antitermination N peptide n=1 Tax=Pantoea sp. CCBC3-3-1 TaxID=2490851 RepID=UPI0011BED53C|nr:hypothetical protein [Pantoea sp. CCBC3-3-1]